jgi:hypothetical protein
MKARAREKKYVESSVSKEKRKGESKQEQYY